MRITLDIHESLLAEARHIAEQQGTPLRAVVEDALRMLIIQRQVGPSASPSCPWPSIAYAKPRPGIDFSDSARLRELGEAPDPVRCACPARLPMPRFPELLLLKWRNVLSDR